MKIINLLRFHLLLMATLLCHTVQAETKLVMLGTGTPVPSHTRAGSGVAVLYHDKAYLFDVGGGVVQRCIEAWKELGIDALNPINISHLFITHFHSDHIVDYPELADKYWWRRDSQINVYGPVGINEMAEAYHQLLRRSVEIRVHGIQPVKNPTFYQTINHEYEKGGWVVQDGEVSIEAFDVIHGDIKPAFAYKITTPDKTIVISGDTAKSEKLIEMAQGVDILVHEVISEEGWSKLSPFWQHYHASAHTRTSDLADIANKAKPELLVLTHVLHYSVPIETVLQEVRQHYKGKVVLANDLDVFE